MNSKRTEREAYNSEDIEEIQKALADLHIKYEIVGRHKHIVSIYKKMREQHKQFDELYDLLDIRDYSETIKD